MRLLLCCESYYPDRGGVQEVMRQIAERMALRGHDVTVATSLNPDRTSPVLNGVKIRGFRASGKLPYGLNGEIDRYRQFVESFDADAILIMAAQQWTFDALWPVLSNLRARKVFIPCGFSCLYEPDFAEYFEQMPEVLKKFDHLIFNAERYRDIDFVKAHGLTNITVLPNGVSEQDFDQPSDPEFRQRLGIPDDDFLFLTVGNPVEAKGHREVIEAFSRLDTAGQSATLICIANWPKKSSLFRDVFALMLLVIKTAKLEGIASVRRRVQRRLAGRLYQQTSNELTETAGSALNAVPYREQESIKKKVAKANAQPCKRVLLIDLPRTDLVKAYMAADLFVFASKVEYSPLVLYEAGAAETPFLTVPVGNSDEIVRWTQGGILCDAVKDSRGYTIVDPQVLALAMFRCMSDRSLLRKLGVTARQRWQMYFTWHVVAGYYEAILSGNVPNVRMGEPTLGNCDLGTASGAR